MSPSPVPFCARLDPRRSKGADGLIREDPRADATVAKVIICINSKEGEISRQGPVVRSRCSSRRFGKKVATSQNDRAERIQPRLE